MTRLLGVTLLISSLFGQEFEVAAIRPSGPRDPVGDMIVSPGGRLTITGFKLSQLIEKAYRVENYQISGGPVWVSQDRFNIIATPPESSRASKFSPSARRDPPPPEELLMLQALLADRFHLKLHRETKEGTVLALVSTNKGPRLQPPKTPDHRPQVMLGFDSDADRARHHYLQGDNATMPLLAQRLAGLLGRPVHDETGVAGNFDFKFSFDEDETHAAVVAAIQQLGLKLESKKAPIETLVIDHAEKPSAN
jgi:uncharacterized protein (TIGR03435 family)